VVSAITLDVHLLSIGRLARYLVVNLSLQPNRQISAVLRDAVLVVGLEETADDVCVVAVRPHASLRDVCCEVRFGPEDGGRRW
jgi:hypothetical protein